LRYINYPKGVIVSLSQSDNLCIGKTKQSMYIGKHNEVSAPGFKFIYITENPVFIVGVVVNPINTMVMFTGVSAGGIIYC
jgi:hypothetical protein